MYFFVKVVPAEECDRMHVQPKFNDFIYFFFGYQEIVDSVDIL